MSARELKQIAALLVSFWTGLLILLLIAPLGLALADAPASDSGAVGRSVEQVGAQVVAQVVANASSSGQGIDPAQRELDKAKEQLAAAASAAQRDADDDAAAAASSAAADDEWADEHASHHHHHGHHGGSDSNDIVAIGYDAELPSDGKAGSVVSVGGDVRSAGSADEAVSVFGSTHVTGPLSSDAVAVLGNLYVDSAVQGDVVGVLGDVELGPHAQIGGDVTSVLGTLKRDPAAIVHGQIESVGGGHISFGWLQQWIRHCAMFGRPLSLHSSVEWAWGFAFAFLTLYVLLALGFSRAIDECVSTFEAEPGRTVLASFLMVLLVPLVLVLLAITLIGLLAWPFAFVALFCAAVFGKTALLAWIGKHVLGARTSGALTHPAAATLLGGVLVLIAYLIPVIGFILWNLLALLSLGLIATTLLRRTPARRAQAAGPPPYAPQGPMMGAAGVAPAAPGTAGASVDAASGAAGSAGAASAAASGPQPDTIASERTESAMNTATDHPGGAAGTAAGSAGGQAGGSAGHHSHRIDPALAATLPRAGFWMRMGALFLDLLLIGFVAHFLGHESHLHLVLLAIYGAIMWKLRGATVGDIVFDLQVARIDGRPVDWETSIVRALGCFLSLFIAFLGFFWIAFDEGKQAWHDKIAGTIVVRVPKTSPVAA